MTDLKILKILRQISRFDLYRLLNDLVVMSAITVRNRVDHGRDYRKLETRFRDMTSKYKPNEMRMMSEAFAVLKRDFRDMIEGHRPFTDYLGDLYMQSETSSSDHGQFFTPYDLSLSSAMLTVDVDSIKAKIADDPHHIITISEPSSGAGGMVVAVMDVLNKAGINYAHNAFAHCMDIDERCVMMTYLTLSLLGVSARVVHGNALTLETWSVWDTPAYIMQYGHFQYRLHAQKDPDFKPVKIERPAPIVEQAPIDIPAGPMVQMELF